MDDILGPDEFGKIDRFVILRACGFDIEDKYSLGIPRTWNNLITEGYLVIEPEYGTNNFYVIEFKDNIFKYSPNGHYIRKVDIETSQQQIINNIREMMIDASISKYELCEAIGISLRTFYNWMNGKTMPGSLDIVFMEQTCGWPKGSLIFRN